MTDEEFNNYLKSFVDVVVRSAHSKWKKYNATLFSVSVSGDETFHAIMGVPETPAQRVQWMGEFGRVLFKDHPKIEACFLAAEAWSASYQKGVINSKSYVPPSQRTDRQEILTFMGLTRDGHSNGADVEVGRTRWRKRMLLANPQFKLYGKEDGTRLENNLLIAFWDGYEAAAKDCAP